MGRGRAQAGSGPERGSGYVPAPVLTQRGCVCVWWEWNEASSCQANAAEVHAYAADHPEFGQAWSHRVEFTANEGYVIGSDGMGTGRPPGRSNAADLDGYLGGICSHQTGQSDDLVGMDRP